MIKIKLLMLLGIFLCSSSIVAQDHNAGEKTDIKSSIMISTAIPNPNEKEVMHYYAKNSKKLLLKAGGVLLGKYKIKKVIHGENAPVLFLVVKFPSEKSIEDYFNSEEYKKLIPYREKAFKEMNIYIAK